MAGGDAKGFGEQELEVVLRLDGAHPDLPAPRTAVEAREGVRVLLLQNVLAVVLVGLRTEPPLVRIELHKTKRKEGRKEGTYRTGDLMVSKKYKTQQPTQR